MKKSNFWSGLISALLGAVLLLTGLLWDTALSSLLCGAGGGLLGSGVLQLLRYRKWSTPANAAAYQERLEQEQIDLRDERKTMLRDRSGRYAYLLGLLACCLSMLVFSVLGALEIVENARLIVLFLGAYLLFQWVAGVFFYRRLAEKY